MGKTPNGEVKGQPGPPSVDSWQIQMAIERIKAEQNLGAGLRAGLIAAMIGGIIWALVTVVTGYRLGLVAVGLGFLVGSSVRHYGKGIDRGFGFMGAFLALLGCVFGDLLSICVLLSREQGIPILEIMSKLTIPIILKLMAANFSLSDIFFYGIAAYEGYKLSFRRVSQQDLSGTLAANSDEDS